MSRIPYGSNPNGVKDNLVFGEAARFSRQDAFDIPIPYERLHEVNPFVNLAEALRGLLGVIPGLSVEEIAYFALRLTEFATSCEGRRVNQYDKISWWDFMRADDFGPLYQNVLTRSLTRNLVAAQAELASTRTIGLQGVRIVVANILFSMYDEASRLLNAPTSEAWIDPWLTHLRAGATMEGANEAARRAVNGLLDLTRWSGDRARVWPVEEPSVFAAAKLEDAFRYALGLPHKLADRSPVDA